MSAGGHDAIPGMVSEGLDTDVVLRQYHVVPEVDALALHHQREIQQSESSEQLGSLCVISQSRKTLTFWCTWEQSEVNFLAVVCDVR